MPLALEPIKTFKVVLEIDKDKPESKQPYFEFRFLTGREWKEVARKADAREETESGVDAIEKIFEVLAFGLVGWGNMIDLKTKAEFLFNTDELDQLVTLKEANELLAKFRNQGVEANDLKNLDLPSGSSSAASAKAAEE